MKYFLRVNIYETQCILYWILGVLILHLGTWHWLGWLSIGYGWLTFASTIWLAGKNHKELKAFFAPAD